ncbi:proliferating cell nuclear antigen (pcna) [Candidatus Pacearchaeota archaeon]|nr:proliferating cell nuclear antigen (pcna) [Candidatus Pacearchaeota archaeon]
MLVKLENPKTLANAIGIISELVVEVRIKFNEEGMNIVAIDPANVAMVEFKLPRTSFSQFDIDDKEVLGVNLDNLKRILKRAGSKSTLILETQENVLKIQIQDRVKRSFSLSLIDVTSEDKEMPSLDFKSKIKLNSVDFIASVEDCSVVADACSFIVEEGGKFVIHAKGLNSAKAEFSGDEAEINAEPCKSRYSLEYLQKFLKGAKLTDKTFLKFSADHPLRVEFANEFMKLNFVLAPRVETED